MTSEPSDRPMKPVNFVRRFLAAIGDLIPLPGDAEAVDPLLQGLDELSPEERAARIEVWQAQMRRGRGDGNG